MLPIPPGPGADGLKTGLVKMPMEKVLMSRNPVRSYLILTWVAEAWIASDSPSSATSGTTLRSVTRVSHHERPPTARKSVEAALCVATPSWIESSQSCDIMQLTG